MRSDYCPAANEPCQAMCALSDVRCKIRDTAPLQRELRRLHEVNAELVEALRLMNIECQHLHHAKKDQHGYDVACPVVERIKTSIAKATGEQQ